MAYLRPRRCALSFLTVGESSSGSALAFLGGRAYDILVVVVVVVDFHEFGGLGGLDRRHLALCGSRDALLWRAGSRALLFGNITVARLEVLHDDLGEVLAEKQLLLQAQKKRDGLRHSPDGVFGEVVADAFHDCVDLGPVVRWLALIVGHDYGH